MFGEMETKDHGFQKVNPYSQHLPYAEFLDAEADQMLNDILVNLSSAVLYREIRPGFVYWLVKLDYYTRMYDHRFTKEQHIQLVKLLYAVVTEPYLSYNVTGLCCRLLADLLQKIKRLSRDDLQLEWRPLFLLARRMTCTKSNRAGALQMPTTKTVNRIWTCVRRCRIYFSAESTQEMLDEFRPMLCPSDVVCDSALIMLSNFLPILLPPEQYDIGHRLWFDELMDMWLNISHYDRRSSSLLYLFTNLAEVTVGHIDWTPWVPRLFNVFLRGFRLPPFTYRPKESISPDLLARFIISLLGDRNRVVMDHLKKLLLTLENFYHPSNAGTFQIHLQRFLCIAKYFCIRFHKERVTGDSWLPKTPESHRLTDEDVTEFCQCLKPIVEVSMFSRYGSVDTARLLRDLVMLRPEIFIPVVLEKSYAALESLNEPHQILNVMPCLSVVARALLTGGKTPAISEDLRYPKGPSHLLPVLRCLLPGIDPNDFSKTVLTATVISAFASLLPIVDCSELLQSDRELTESQREMCEASAQWEDFLLQLLDRCFCVFEQLSMTPEMMSSRPGIRVDDASQESLMGAKLSTSMLHLLQQCSPALFEVACKRMFSFATSHVLECKVAGCAFADMLENACQVNADLVWKTFFPHCYQTILQLVTDGDAESDKPDLDLIWNIQLVTGLANGVNACALQYKDEIVDLCHHILHLKNKEAYNMASDFLAGLLTALTTIYCAEKRSTGEDFSASPLERDYLKDWGAGMHVNELEVKWHVPCPEELQFVAVLLREFLDPEVVKLQELLDGKCEMDKEELHLRLSVLSACLEGAGTILPSIRTGQPVVDLEVLEIKSEVELVPQTSVFRTTCPAQDEAAAQHATRRLDTANLMHKLLDHIWECREDDTVAMAMIVACYSVLITDRGSPREKVDARQMYNDSRSTIFFDRVSGKKNRPRAILIDRVELQHLKRVTTQFSLPACQAHLDILDRIIKLSLSRYTSVRIAAQQVLPDVVCQFSGCIRHALPSVLDCLKQSDSLTHEQLKGALFILNLDPISRYMSGRYYDMLSILPVLLQADHSDKPSIAQLVRLIIRQLLVQGNYPSLREEMSDSCLAVARHVAECANVPDIDGIIAKGSTLELETSQKNVSYEIMQKWQDLGNSVAYLEFALRRLPSTLPVRYMLLSSRCVFEWAYDSLVMSLVKILQDEKVRLSHLQFCGGVLSALIRHDYPLPLPAIKVYVDGLVHDILQYRRLSWTTLVIILRQLRVPCDKITFTAAELGAGAKKTGEEVEEALSNNSKNFPAGLRSDNHWITYDPATVPKTKEEWNSCQFVHKPHWGYAGWPRTLRLYAPSGQQKSLAKHLTELTESEVMIQNVFQSEEFVSKLMDLFSLEVNKGRDIFDPGRFNLFKALFRNYLDTFVDILRPHVERLAVDPLENNQRCAAEIIAGMLCSCRHWSYEKIESLKEWLAPLLRTVFQKISVDASRDWSACIGSAVGDRDPRSLYWLYEILFSCQMTSAGGSFGDGARLHFLERCIAETEWKAPQLLHRMRGLLREHISNPYQIIRSSVASVLGSSVLRYDRHTVHLEFPGQVPLRGDFLAEVMPTMEILYSDEASSPSEAASQQATPTVTVNTAQLVMALQQQGINLEDASLHPQVAALLKQAAASAGSSATSSMSTSPARATPLGETGNGNGFVAVELPSVSQTGDDEPDRAVVVLDVPQDDEPMEIGKEEKADDSKEQRAIATRTFKTVCSWLAGGYSDVLNTILAPMLPLICSQHGKEHDPELSRVVAQAQRAMVFSRLHPGDFLPFLESLEKAIGNLGWHGRKASLSFIKRIITTNLFTASVHKVDMEQTLKLVLTLLEDEQQEVRKEASDCLSALVHVELVTVSPSLLGQLKGLCATPLPKKRTLAQLAANFVPRDLVLRHAGTLGLCALILAYPYTVPSWMPELLMVLDGHMTDPSPIQSTVRESLSEFKRTHHDNWEVHKLAFTDDQLQVLTELLVSPSYYV